jgi:hypothetical protein
MLPLHLAACRLVTDPGFTGGCGSLSGVKYSFVSCTAYYLDSDGVTWTTEPNTSGACLMSGANLFVQDAQVL